jgi:2-amino-4-hydroxy-6-hydroxymethyldihydropteridine diphosphokinase
MPIVYLAVGSNLGDRSGNLIAAVRNLEPLANVLKCSPVYETSPWGYEDQPDYLNQVIMAETDLSPGDLLIYLKRIEIDLGREESFRFGPRSIDIDILFYDDQIVELPKLTIPHPSINERAFVLVPMADIAPNYEHPVLGETIEALLEMVNRDGVKYFSSSGCNEKTG